MSPIIAKRKMTRDPDPAGAPPATGARPRKIFRAVGHLVDSGIMKEILDTIIREGGSFDISRFVMGKTNQDPSQLEAEYQAPDLAALQRIARRLTDLGVEVDAGRRAPTEPAPAAGVAPPGFYTTTTHDTEINLDGALVPVENIRMDGVIVVRDQRALCIKQRDIERGDRVVVGLEGIKVSPEFVERDRSEFGFMHDLVLRDIASLKEMLTDIQPEDLVEAVTLLEKADVVYLVGQLRYGY